MTNPYYGKFDDMVAALVRTTTLKFADFFCGIGGFHLAASNLGMECVFASDIDAECRKAYKANFNIQPYGDITRLKPEKVPDHDFMFAGFPCQPFSIIGKREGFDDPRGTLFFELLNIIREKMPPYIVLENVKQLATANKGQVIETIMNDLEDAGYYAQYKILNCLNFGLPQKRERTIIVASLYDLSTFSWPDESTPMLPLSEILEDNPDHKHFVSERIKAKRLAAHTPKTTPSIWHENKSGNISSYPYSCALRAGASYNYLLVDGIRRFTPREMLRLQGFPDTYKIVCTDSQIRKQAGNAVPVPLVQSVIKEVLNAIEESETTRELKKTA